MTPLKKGERHSVFLQAKAHCLLQEQRNNYFKFSCPTVLPSPPCCIYLKVFWLGLSSRSYLKYQTQGKLKGALNVVIPNK